MCTDPSNTKEERASVFPEYRVFAMKTSVLTQFFLLRRDIGFMQPPGSSMCTSPVGQSIRRDDEVTRLIGKGSLV